MRKYTARDARSDVRYLAGVIKRYEKHMRGQKDLIGTTSFVTERLIIWMVKRELRRGK